MIPKWMIKLEEDREEFSELVHNYYKLATMRVMQKIRADYDVPPEGIPLLVMSIMARFLNESVYSVGGNIKENVKITDIYKKEHLLNLLKVLNNETVSPFDRKDIDTDIQNMLKKFKEFILKNADDFRL